MTLNYYQNNAIDQEPLIFSSRGSSIKAQTMRIENVNGSLNMVSQQIFYSAIWLPKAATITGAAFAIQVQGSYTANNFNGIALYTYSGGTITQVAITANTGTLWQGPTNTFQKIAFTGTYSANAGLYFIGLLYSQSAETTKPGIRAGSYATPLGSMDFSNSAKISSARSSQTSLPASETMSNLALQNVWLWLGLY
jgi:hypothetical protein